MKKVTMCIFISIGILMIIFIGINGFTLAKYVAKSSWNYYLESKGFYFDSNDLNGNDNVNNNWDGRSTYFTISNSYNDSLVTAFDINYEASCTVLGEVNARCIMNGSGDSTYTGTLSGTVSCVNNIDSVDVSSYNRSKCERDGYSWEETPTSSNLYFDVVSGDSSELTGVSVLVEVKSTSPYKKTLSSKYILNKGSGEIGELKVNYKEDGLNNRVIVTNSYNDNKCVKLSWDSSKLRIDIDTSSVSSYDTDGDGYINEITFNINKHDSVNYLFYKAIVGEVINNSFFNLIETNSC